jgi:hypothetical protein
VITNEKITTVKVRESLRQQLKIQAAVQGISLQCIVDKVFSNWLAEEAQQPGIAPAPAQDLGQYENAANNQVSRVTPATRRG